MTRRLPAPSSAPSDDFAQLRDTFDTSVAPSPSFAARLRVQVHQHAHAASPFAAEEGDSTSAPHPTPTGSHPRRSIRLLEPTPRRVRTLESALAAALLAVVVSALILGFARLQRDGGTPEHQMAAAITTPTASSPTNRDANIGRSWAFDIPAFTSGQVSISQGGESSDFANRQAAIANGSVIVTQHWKQADDDTTVLEAFSLKGGTLWQVPIGAMPGMAIDDTQLYVIRDDRDALTDSTSRPLTAISLETGNVVWTGPDVGGSGKSVWGWSPIVLGDTVYVANGKGSTWAMDARTGQIRWTSIVPDDAMPNRADGSSITETGGSIVLGNGALWVAGWTNTIRKLDPNTGDLLATITLGKGLRELDLYARDTSLVVHAKTEGTNAPVTSVLVAIDMPTDTIRWVQPLPTRVDDNLVLLRDRVIVARIDAGVSPMLNVDAYDLASGTLSAIPMPSLKTSMASLAALDGPAPLLLIVAQDGSLTVVNVETGHVVGEQAGQDPATPSTYRPLPVLIVGDETPIVAQPNGSWYRIAPG